MHRNTIWIIFFGLILGGCASDPKIETMESSGGPTSTPAVSSPTMSAPAATESTATSPQMSGTAASESSAMNQSKSTSQTRIAAGVEEETLDSCLGRIPKDATAGQQMMAEHTCRRDFSVRR
jgi:hypothetical protein